MPIEVQITIIGPRGAGKSYLANKFRRVIQTQQDALPAIPINATITEAAPANSYGDVKFAGEPFYPDDHSNLGEI